MGRLGDNPEIYRVEEPVEAPAFVPAKPSRKEEPAEVPDWLNPNKVKQPVPSKQAR